jgi:hypothetical protein
VIRSSRRRGVVIAIIGAGAAVYAYLGYAQLASVVAGSRVDTPAMATPLAYGWLGGMLVGLTLVVYGVSRAARRPAAR